MTTSRTLLVAVAGLLAGAAGFYAGLFSLLAITGLDAPSWAPLAQLAGSAVFIGAATSITAGLAMSRAVGLTVALTMIAIGAGATIMALDLDFEAAIVAALSLVAVSTFGSRILTASAADHSRSSSHAGMRAA